MRAVMVDMSATSATSVPDFKYVPTRSCSRWVVTVPVMGLVTSRCLTSSAKLRWRSVDLLAFVLGGSKILIAQAGLGGASRSVMQISAGLADRGLQFQAAQAQHGLTGNDVLSFAGEDLGYGSRQLRCGSRLCEPVPARSGRSRTQARRAQTEDSRTVTPTIAARTGVNQATTRSFLSR